MKKLSFIICLHITAFANAQKVNYTVLSDDPKNVKAFSLSLEPFYADLGAPDIHLGYSVRADLLLFKRLELRADFRKAYLDINGDETKKQYFYPKKEAKKATFAEAGISLFFSDKIKKSQAKLVLSSRTSGNTTYTKYIMIPALKRKLFGVRGGLYLNSLAFQVDDNGEFFEVAAKDPNATATAAMDNTVSMYTTSVLYGGLHFKTIVDVVAKTDYGTKKVGSMTDFYLDVLFAPIVNFSDVMSPDGVLHKMDAKSENVKRIGWRAGWTYRHPNKVAFCYKLELGARPGFRSGDKISIKSERIFLMMTMGFNIPAGKKHSGE